MWKQRRKADIPHHFESTFPYNYRNGQSRKTDLAGGMKEPVNLFGFVENVSKKGKIDIIQLA